MVNGRQTDFVDTALYMYPHVNSFFFSAFFSIFYACHNPSMHCHNPSMHLLIRQLVYRLSHACINSSVRDVSYPMHL